MMEQRKLMDLLADESDKQQQRLEKLYGPGNYTGTIKKNLKRTVWLIGISILFFLLILLLQLSKSDLDNQGIVLDQQGNIKSVERPTSGDSSVVLEAEVISEAGDKLSEQGVKLIISPLQKIGDENLAKTVESGENNDDIIQHEIRKIIYQLNEDAIDSTVILPNILTNGTRIHWAPKEKNNGILLIIIFILTAFAIYKNKDAKITRTEKEARDSVLKELPEFVNKLVLLLNAGLILNNAFHKIVSDFQKLRGGENNYFYRQLEQIMVKCSETNGSVQQEIRSFAVRTGVVEFMRLSNIISDSMTKGSDLMVQLKMEGDSLWAARRKQMEEKGKIAETKLTFPLVILLLVLVMITIAPAMMEM